MVKIMGLETENKDCETNLREKRLERVLTVDPGIGIARHVDAGYERAKDIAIKKEIKIPG